MNAWMVSQGWGLGLPEVLARLRGAGVRSEGGAGRGELVPLSRSRPIASPHVDSDPQAVAQRADRASACCSTVCTAAPWRSGG